MTLRARTIAIVVASVMLAGCVAAPAASPSPPPSTDAPTPAPSVAPAAPTAPPAAPPAASPTLTPPGSAASFVSPSQVVAASPAMPHADPDLEASLPASMAGAALTRFSMPGSSFTGGSDMCILLCGDEPYRYAKELGVDIDDVTVAFAVSDTLAIGMIAYRARGAANDDLIPARIAIGGYTGHGGLYDLPVTVAGRHATYLDAGMATSGEYLMTRHDVLFIVFGEAPSKGTCRPGNCASQPPGPWTAPSYVIEALGGLS